MAERIEDPSIILKRKHDDARNRKKRLKRQKAKSARGVGGYTNKILAPFKPRSSKKKEIFQYSKKESYHLLNPPCKKMTPFQLSCGT